MCIVFILFVLTYLDLKNDALSTTAILPKKGVEEYLLLLREEIVENGTSTGKYVCAYRIIEADQ
jgi:hypothetical protein